jgi:hypothetical protein
MRLFPLLGRRRRADEPIRKPRSKAQGSDIGFINGLNCCLARHQADILAEAVWESQKTPVYRSVVVNDPMGRSGRLQLGRAFVF